MYFPDEMPQTPKRKRKWLRRIVIVIFVFLFLFGGGLMLLARMGGNDENLRVGLENIIGKAAGGHPTRVEKLHIFTFFPYLRVFAEDISVKALPENIEDAENPGPPLLTVGTLMFSRDFWDVFFQRNYVEGILLEDITTAPGFIFPRPISQADLRLAPDIFDGGPGMEFSGFYGDQAFTLHLGLTHKLRNQRPLFSLPKSAPLSLTLGDMTLRGTLSRGRQGAEIMVEELDWAHPGAAASLLPASLTVTYLRSMGQGQLTVHHKTAHSSLTILHKEGPQSSLSLAAEKLHSADIIPLLSFYEFLLQAYFGDREKLSFGPLHRLAVRIDRLIHHENNQDHDLGKFAFTGPFDRDGNYRADNLKGTLLGGPLGGTISFDHNAENALRTSWTLKDFTMLSGQDYQELSATLQAGGTKLSDFADNITGNATLIAPGSCHTGPVNLIKGTLSFSPQPCPADNQ